MTTDANDYELSPWDTVKLIQTLMPLLTQCQRLLAEPDDYRKVIIVGDALEWAASKSQTPLDDELVRLVGDVVKTPQGEALIRWIVKHTLGK